MGPFDFEDGDFINECGDIGFDSDGHMMQNMGGGMAMDMETGDMHLVSGWDDDDDED